MKTKNQFKDCKGRLSDYALSCGYIEKHDNEGINTTLWKEPACKVYQVRQHNFNTGKRVFWKSFDVRLEAYKFFKSSI